MSTTIFHNPRCSKSRATLALLQERGIDPQIILYLEAPPTSDQLNEVLQKLALAPTQMVRFKEKRAKELGISASDEKSASDWIEILIEDPILLERPIVIHGDRAAIGRPPENVLDILD